MKTTKFIKILNETEVGRTGTNDTYILISMSQDVSDIFPSIDTDYNFIDKETQNRFSLRRTSGRENRITKLGTYYRFKEARGASRICLELIQYKNGQIIRFIDIINPISMYLQYNINHGFKILNEHDNILETKQQLIDYKGNLKDIHLTFSKSIYPRTNSKNSTDYYELIVNDNHFGKTEAISNNEMIEIEETEHKGVYRINRRPTYTKIITEVDL